jgi:hypothetical protein
MSAVSAVRQRLARHVDAVAEVKVDTSSGVSRHTLRPPQPLASRMRTILTTMLELIFVLSRVLELVLELTLS